MPDLREMLGKAREEEAQRAKRKITKGVRPDRILRGEIQFGDDGQIISQTKTAPRLSLETSDQPPPLTPKSPKTTVQETGAISRPNRGQTEAKPGTELRPIQPIYSLDGLQRKILFLIFDHCKQARDKQTPPIAVQHITESCKTTYHAARKAIQRLEQKGLLDKVFEIDFLEIQKSGWLGVRATVSEKIQDFEYYVEVLKGIIARLK